MRILLAALLLLSQDPEVQKVIQRLGSSDFEEQGKAAKILEGLGSDALPDLETATRSTNAQIRDWAVKIKGRIELRLGRKAAPKAEDPTPRKFEPAAGWTSRYPSRSAPRDKSLAASEAGVARALKWLSLHQSPGGSWHPDLPATCCKSSPFSAGHPVFETGLTGLALLAFLGAGHATESADYGAVVQKGLSWLIAKQDPEGLVGPRDMKHLYNHMVGSLALCEAYLMTGAPELRAAALKAMEYTVSAQNLGRGWRYSKLCNDNDTSVTGWAVMGLKSAELAGFDPPKAAMAGGLSWIDDATEMSGYYQVGYNARSTGKVFVPGKNEQFDHHATMTAIGVFCRVLHQKRRGDPALAGVNLMLADLPEWKTNKTDLYYWHWGSLAVQQLESQTAGGKKWFDAVRNALLTHQQPAGVGCPAGSWDPDQERWGFDGGRVYTTALGAMILETPYRYPSFLTDKTPAKKK